MSEKQTTQIISKVTNAQRTDTEDDLSPLLWNTMASPCSSLPQALLMPLASSAQCLHIFRGNVSSSSTLQIMWRHKWLVLAALSTTLVISVASFMTLVTNLNEQNKSEYLEESKSVQVTRAPNWMQRTELNASPNTVTAQRCANEGQTEAGIPPSFHSPPGSSLPPPGPPSPWACSSVWSSSPYTCPHINNCVWILRSTPIPKRLFHCLHIYSAPGTQI